MIRRIGMLVICGGLWLTLLASCGGDMTPPAPTDTKSELGTINQAMTLCNDTLAIGQTTRKTMTLALIPSVPPKADIIFGSDLTSSMTDEVAKAKTNSTGIMNQITNLIPDTWFGAMSFKDYPKSYNHCGYQTSTGGGVLYGSGADYPYRLDQQVTVNKASVSAAINTWTISNDPNTDYPASYTRALWEMYNDTTIGWRTGSKRFIILFGDALPHDCAFVISPYTINTGADPGRDTIAGTSDDLKWDATTTGLKTNNISLVTLYSGPAKLKLGGGPPLDVFKFWDEHSQKTGGGAFQLDQQGNLPNNANIADFIKQKVQALSATIQNLTIELCKDQNSIYASWLSNPDTRTNVTSGTGPHNLGISVTPPTGASTGSHTFAVCIYGDGVEYARETCTINVTGCTLPGVGTPCSVGVGACRRTGTQTCNAAGTALVCDATAGTPTAEICDGIDNNCNGQTDETWPTKGTACTVGTGACQRNGTFVCNTAQNGITCSVTAAAPTAEKCDGIDNDCDGSIDEDFPTKGQACTVGLGACQRSGLNQCKADGSGLQCGSGPGTPTAELCDGIDNDCDGQVDEDFAGKGSPCTVGVGACSRTGTQICRANGSGLQCSVSAGSPTTERCDGIDNDCDGQIDETFPTKGQTCTVGLGPCLRTGTVVCSSDGSQAVCNVSAGTPTAEKCDGIDNNCNGTIDENFPDKGKACSVGVGECLRTGTFNCKSDGSALACSATAGAPSPEICDQKDNNCDGQVDEGCQCTPGINRPCYSGPSGTQSNAPCKAGIQTCNAGKWGSCVGQVTPTTELCDGIDNDCDGTIDEDFPEKSKACTAGTGACQRTGTYVCNPAKTAAICSVTAAAPSAEICDGIDNDCDGQIDEDFPTKGQACTVGVGPCSNTGVFQCNAAKTGVACSVTAKPGTPELCDNLDNNCDGKVDEGLSKACTTACGAGTQVCAAGVWGPCQGPQPKAETCDNTDEDCDGTIDNGLSRPCQTACGAGQEICQAGMWQACSAPAPKAEICDGIDNDCNGKVDDGIPPQACQGACGSGNAVCESGQFVGCTGLQPKPEVCDGIDNDCDGKIDNIDPRTCRSECGEGKETCIAGVWKDCDAPKPADEVCDGLDNNCDGFIDNKAPCPTAQGCYQGKCTPTCLEDKECGDGNQCVEGFCSGDPCKGVECPDGKSCVSGHCVDACATITCPDGEVCRDGKCRENSCYGLGCPGGQVCKLGKCEPDACLTATCKANQACRDGQCVDSCAWVTCPLGKRCQDGTCTDDPCQTKTCTNGQICVNGTCTEDPCKSLNCGEGRVCDPAQKKCVDDPCLTLQCPNGQPCKAGQCTPGAGQEPPPGEAEATTELPITQTGGDAGTNQDNNTTKPPSGCGCHTQGNDTQIPGFPALALLLILAWGCRRKARHHG